MDGESFKKKSVFNLLNSRSGRMCKGKLISIKIKSAITNRPWDFAQVQVLVCGKQGLGKRLHGHFQFRRGLMWPTVHLPRSILKQPRPHKHGLAWQSVASIWQHVTIQTSVFASRNSNSKPYRTIWQQLAPDAPFGSPSLNINFTTVLSNH